MITSIEIHNFKALENFKISELGRLVCLIGMNGAGKSTLLQALDFLANSFDNLGNFRDWKNADILCAKSKLRSCSFSLGIRLGSGSKLTWFGRFNVDKWRFIEENVKAEDGAILLMTKEGKMTISDGVSETVDLTDLTFTGSVFSTRKFESSPRLRELKEIFLGLKSFELLAPDELRRGVRSTNEMTLGGRGLAGYIKMLESQGEKEDLTTDLKAFYPHLRSIPQTKPGPGWFGFAINESYGAEVKTDMKHVNDGFLRVLAILAQRFSGKSILLFDEIENGINQELIGRLMEFLVTKFTDKQVFVTTHSSLVLNYLSDEAVRDGVILIYRDELGRSLGCKFFKIPAVEEKLSYLNAGQVMADTDLIELATTLPSSEVK